MTELFHQLGFRYQWNLTSINEEQTGDGIIIGPRWMDYQEVTSLPIEVRQQAIFDPQFYVPNSERNKLLTYPFFPSVVADGFSTGEWTDDLALKSAIACLEFQAQNDFRYLVIPTRYTAGMPSDFIVNQSTLFVDPFLNVYRDLDTTKPCLLQLVLTDQMLKDKSYRRDILNWVTGLKEVEGIYLLYDFQRPHKQIEDIDFLISVYFFVRALKKAGMIVAMGYLNTEAIPLLCAEPDIMTMGSYENLRMFNLDSFREEEPGARRGPNPRIYVSRLLQWIEHNYIGAIMRLVGDTEEYFDDNLHRVPMFEPTYSWHFQKPEPYKHYFVAFSNQFRRISEYNGIERLRVLQQECNRAMVEFDRLGSRIIFDPNSSGQHLPMWLTFLNEVESIDEEF
jgi:hypothetical protein